MSLFLEHLRGGDDIIYGGLFEPTRSASTLILWECPEDLGPDQSWVPMYKTADEVITDLANNNLRFRAAIGLPFQEWNGSSWLPVTKGTEFGPMLVRDMTVEEHPNKPHAWKITLSESSMGNLLDSGDAAQGAPALSVNVSARTRNMKAWRMGIEAIPVDQELSANSSFFDPQPWQLCDSTTDDMGGASIVYNGIP